MKTWQSLGYLGLIPFFACFVVGLFFKEWLNDALQIFVFYSAIILSFISGTFWQVSSKLDNAKQQIISNVFCLLAFVSLLLAEQLALIILAAGYVSIFLYEKYAITRSEVLDAYINMRFQLTATLLLLHCSMWILLK